MRPLNTPPAQSSSVPRQSASTTMEAQLDAETTLAAKFVEEADIKNLHALFLKRTQQMRDMAKAFVVMTEMCAEKGQWKPLDDEPPKDAVASMERVALAAIDLAKTIATAERGEA